MLLYANSEKHADLLNWKQLTSIACQYGSQFGVSEREFERLRHLTVGELFDWDDPRFTGVVDNGRD
jgi:hypothetical protein